MCIRILTTESSQRFRSDWRLRGSRPQPHVIRTIRKPPRRSERRGASVRSRGHASQVPERNEQGKVAGDRPPGAGLRAVRGPDLEGQPARRPPARVGAGRRPWRRPRGDPDRRDPGPGGRNQAPEERCYDQASQIRRRRAHEHVQKEREDPGAAHVWNCGLRAGNCELKMPPVPVLSPTATSISRDACPRMRSRDWLAGSAIGSRPRRSSKRPASPFATRPGSSRYARWTSAARPPWWGASR
jgi:hypothetical protein